VGGEPDREGCSFVRQIVKWKASFKKGARPHGREKKSALCEEKSQNTTEEDGESKKSKEGRGPKRVAKRVKGHMTGEQGTG